MDGPATRPAAPATDSGTVGDSRWWLAVLLGLAVWQGWMTLTLFGPGDRLGRLLDDEPVVSGDHPLHLYHGFLGARSLLDRGTGSCYDPAFQAGYPKTPVFDGGSRPAELFLTVAGAAYRPAAYKVGLAVCCLAVPWLLLVTARGAGLHRGPAVVAVGLGLLVWWGTPCHDALVAGDLDVLIAGLAAAVYAGMLVRFDRAPGPVTWLAVLAAGCLAWFTDPFVSLLLVPLSLVYYLSVGARHRLGWHTALLAALAGGPVCNVFWLPDWAESWWLRLPVQLGAPALAHRTPHTVWQASLWGEPADRALAVALMGTALIGGWVLNQNNQRPAARLLGLGAGGLLALAIGGIAWGALGRFGTERLLAPALWFAAVPSAAALGHVFYYAHRLTGARWAGVVVGCGVLLAAGFTGRHSAVELAGRSAGAVPLEIGLGPERQALVDALGRHTTADARILWEERTDGEDGSRWTALLPLLTGRSFLGGLGPHPGIEHGYACLADQALAGRPLAEWADADLAAFCRRYNVGWAACWSPGVVARLRAWPAAQAVTPLGGGWLFRLPAGSFVLVGQARLLHADSQQIVLGDVVPDRGRVVLSFHYQAGMQAAPARVRVEREPDPADPIPFVRLRLAGPAARVTLTWGNP